MNDTLVDAVLARLGIAPPPCTRAGAEAVFAAWCLGVSFDNVLKRLALASGASMPLPGLPSAGFFVQWRDTGAGGTCWATSNALHDLYRSLGFAARRASASMGGGTEPNHGTVLVDIDGELLLADASMLGGTLLELRAEPTRAGSGLVPLEAAPDGDSWMVRFGRAHLPGEMMQCRLLDLAVDERFFEQRYEISRTVSGFNSALFARKNRADGSIVVLKADTRYVRTSSGVETSPIVDEARTLAEDIGIQLFKR